MRILCKSKIHRATVTDANLQYEGSITIDKDLMQAADLIEYEQVHVVNINNGERFITYVIEGHAGSGDICLNGAASRCVQINDQVIIMAYSEYQPQEVASFTPAIVFVDSRNKTIIREKVL